MIIKGNTPSKSNCYRIGNKTLFKSHALKKFEESFYWQLPAAWRNKNIKGLFEIYLDVYYPSKRSDLDNSTKVILDCLQKTRTIRNDNQCSKLVAQKFIDRTDPRIEIEIIEI